jgi:hypothetical protein
MEFSGIPWNFPWNSMKFSVEFNFHETEVDEIPWKIPWNFMEFREFTEFDGIRFRQGFIF